MVASDHCGDTSPPSSIPVLGMSVCVQALVLCAQGPARRDENFQLLMDLWIAHNSVSLPNLSTLDTSWSVLLPQEVLWALAAGDLQLLGLPELWSTNAAGIFSRHPSVLSNHRLPHQGCFPHPEQLFSFSCAVPIPGLVWEDRRDVPALSEDWSLPNRGCRASSLQTWKRTKL